MNCELKSLSFLFSIFTLFLFSACIDEEEHADTPRGNFEALWKIFDEHYCFFDYKREQLGVDWDEIHARYARQFDDNMTEQQQFEVMTRMIGELRDGHVNISTAFDYGRNWSWATTFWIVRQRHST